MSDFDTAINPYPEDCPFCANAAAYPAPDSSLWGTDLTASIPKTVDITQITPSCFLVLSAPRVLAFLDIQPMTAGHLLVVAREHRPKVEHLQAEESRDIGFWLPLLATAVKKVTGTADYNIVQNNGTLNHKPTRAFAFALSLSIASAFCAEAGDDRDSRCSGGAACALPHHSASSARTGAQEQELDHVWARAAGRSGRR